MARHMAIGTMKQGPQGHSAGHTMNKLAASHTLVIPTFNRSELLEKLLRFYVGHAETSMNILVLDSSEPTTLKINADMIAAVLNIVEDGSTTLRHLTFPNDLPMAQKLARGLKAVDTEYASFCADDDVVFPSGLAAAVDHLNKDRRTVAVHGLYVSFMPTTELEIYLQNEYSGVSLDADQSGARIFQLCQRYESLFYAVCRTDQLRNVFDVVGQIESLAFQEFFQSVALLTMGRAIRLPIYYAGRRSGEAAEPDRDKWQTYYWFADNPGEVLEHYLDFRQRMLGFYSANSDDDPLLDQGSFNQVLDLALMGYFAGGYPPAYMHSRLEHLWPTTPYADAKDLDMLPRMNVHQQANARLPLTVRIWRWATERFAPPARHHPNPQDLPFEWMRDDEHDLNKAVAETGMSHWKARIPQSIEWVRDHPSFRSSYLELCKYLDSGPSDASKPQ